MRLELLTETGNVVSRIHLDTRFEFRGDWLVNVDRIDIPVDHYTGERITMFALAGENIYRKYTLVEPVQLASGDGPFFFEPGAVKMSAAG